MKLPTGLTKVDRSLLADLVDSPHWKPLKKLLALKQMEIAQQGLMGATSMEGVKYNQGQIASIKYIEEAIRQLHQKEQSKSTKEVILNE